ncbi:MAG: response regulator transcription factor, partial [bacterium]|nr:response regulator transcription factor [bacterium]
GSEFIIRLPMGSKHLSSGEMSGTPTRIKGTPARIKETPIDISVDIPVHENEIPMGIEESAPETHLELEAVAGADQKNIILVVEDSSDLRSYIRGTLEADYTILEARDGREGIQKALDIIPDLIISDVMMPEIGGYELCSVLKNDIKTCHIPIILLTAKASDENILQGLETRADDYITKPFNTKILSARIRNLIHIRSQLQININRDMNPQSLTTPISKMDREFLRELHEVVNKNLSDEDFCVAELSKKLYMSRATIYRKVQALTGSTPNEFIKSYRLKRGAELLKQNHGTILEVAFEVGFSSSSYFTRCFREKFHRSPSEYKAANQG